MVSLYFMKLPEYFLFISTYLIGSRCIIIGFLEDHSLKIFPPEFKCPVCHQMVGLASGFVQWTTNALCPNTGGALPVISL